MQYDGIVDMTNDTASACGGRLQISALDENGSHHLIRMFDFNNHMVKYYRRVSYLYNHGVQ